MSKSRDVTTKNRRAITWLVICSFPLIGAGSCGTSRGTLCGKMVDSVSYEGVEGVELTLKSLVDVLAKNGITPVDPHGEPFDPQVAQAMSMVENPDVEPNTVIAVMQKGYLLKDRLLRPAMVMVSKAAS